MLRRGRLIILASLALAFSATGHSTRTATARPGLDRDGAHRVTFERRLLAEAAIERVYFSHRIGATRPFEEAVPRQLLERKVRTYLSQSVALDTLWKSPISAEALRRELERIAASTRFPERLREIYEALDNDPYLIQETFVRAALADRLTRGYFAGGPAGTTRQDWETWWLDAERQIDPALAHEVAGDLTRLPEPGSRAGESSPALTFDTAAAGAGGAASPCALQDL